MRMEADKYFEDAVAQCWMILEWLNLRINLQIPIDAIFSNTLIEIITEGYKIIGDNTFQMISIAYVN